MQRDVRHRMQLDVARQHAFGLAVDLDVIQTGEKTAAHVFACHVAHVQRQHDGVFFVAVNHGGNLAFATHGTGGPLAGPFPHCGRKRFYFSHCSFSKFVSFCRWTVGSDIHPPLKHFPGAASKGAASPRHVSTALTYRFGRSPGSGIPFSQTGLKPTVPR